MKADGAGRGGEPGGEEPDRRGGAPEPGGEELEEFQDEPPGAVLFEMRPRPVLWVWGALDLLAAAVLGALALLTSPSDLGGGRLPLALLWLFLPISALLGLLLTAFIWINLPHGEAPRSVLRWAAALQLLSLLAWAALHWGAGAAF